MLAKTREILATLTLRLSSTRVPMMWGITAYFAAVVVLISTYYGAWLYLSFSGEIVLADLLAIIQEMTGPAMISFVTFIAGCFVDMNKNGIPDRLEEYDEKDKP